MREMGRKGGQASGKARMEKLTPEHRSEIARKAAAVSADVRTKKALAKKKKAAKVAAQLKLKGK